MLLLMWHCCHCLMSLLVPFLMALLLLLVVLLVPPLVVLLVACCWQWWHPWSLCSWHCWWHWCCHQCPWRCLQRGHRCWCHWCVFSPCHRRWPHGWLCVVTAPLRALPAASPPARQGAR